MSLAITPAGRRIALAAFLLVAAAVLIAAAPAAAQFAAKTKVLDLDATCVSKGEGKGRVLLDITVRYADAAADAEAMYEGKGHTVSVSSKVRARGKTVAKLTDGANAQEAIPELSSYAHVHRHELSRKQSRKVLGGKKCGKGKPVVVRVKARARQVLGASFGVPQAKGAAAPVATQSNRSNLSATVSAGQPGAVIGGCLIAQDSNCHGVNLSGADLSNVNAPYSDFSFADLSNANLSGARLGHAIMNKTNLQFADMKGVLLGSAGLTSAIILSADLTGAQLPFSNLANASLEGSNISGANLTGTGLYGTIFSSTTCDENTLLPAVFPHRCVNGSVTQ